MGRDGELAQLRQAFERARRERRAHLVTVFGEAGIGKTRLVQELAASVDGEAAVLTGRCLSYGEGITYWPLREIVGQATGAAGVRALLEGSPDADVVAERLESAIGVGTGGAVREEVFWAVRKLVEALARETPLLLVFEDIHWGEPTLLDLVEHLADWVRDVPVLLLCLARPELLDGRPAWGGGKLNATSILLEPLSRDESSELIGVLPGGAALAGEAQARIADAAEGNPLFLEQMLAMLAEDDDSERQDLRPTCDSGAACRPARPARARRARRARARLRRGGVVPRRRSGRPLAATDAGVGGDPPWWPRSQGADPGRARDAAGRGGVPLSSCADPRRRLRGPREGGEVRAPRSPRRLARAGPRRPCRRS